MPERPSKPTSSAPTTAASRPCARATGPRSRPPSPTTWSTCTPPRGWRGKGEHVGNLKAGKPHYRGIAPRDRKVRVLGGVGIVNGVSEMRVENAGKEQRFTVRYLAVYAKAGDAWRMIAWQSTQGARRVAPAPTTRSRAGRAPA